MASVTDICNRALSKLGAGRVTSLQDQSTNARACNSCYEILRDAELRIHPWNFAIQRFLLPASPISPDLGSAFGPQNAFPLPTGALRLLPPDVPRGLSTRDWKVESNQVITNDQAPLPVRCVMRITDTTVFDPLFIEVLACKMASEMCEQLTQSNTKKQAAEAGYKAAILEAKRANAFENVPMIAPEDTWITARIAGSSSIGGWGIGWSV